MRSLLALGVWSLVILGAACHGEDDPVLPLDAAELYSIFKVVPAGTPGAKEITNIPPALQSKVDGKLYVSPEPLLTFRDVEKIQFPDQTFGDFGGQRQVLNTLGRITFSEWGARRRARSEKEKGTRQLCFEDGVLTQIWTADGSMVMGRQGFFSFKGELSDLMDLNSRMQDALQALKEQPLRTISTSGEHPLGPGWSLQAEPADKGLRLRVKGPNRPAGGTYSADATLETKPSAPFLICWESRYCVLWAASAESLLSIRFTASGDPVVSAGEREQSLFYSDAPAAVRSEIEKVFPPRDGDPKTHFGIVEGTALFADRPAAGTIVSVWANYEPDTHDGENHKVTTDANGHFRIEGIHTPSRLVVSIDMLKWLHPNTKEVESTSGGALTFFSHLDTGQVRKLTLGGAGQPVTGRITDPANAQRDWSRSEVELVLVAPCSLTLEELRERKLNDMADVYEKFLKSDEGQAYRPANVALKADGTFRFERVPTAHYWIYVHPDGAEKGTRVGSLSMGMFPEGKSDQVRDVGALTLLDHDAPAY